MYELMGQGYCTYPQVKDHISCHILGYSLANYDTVSLILLNVFPPFVYKYFHVNRDWAEYRLGMFLFTEDNISTMKNPTEIGGGH